MIWDEYEKQVYFNKLEVLTDFLKGCSLYETRYTYFDAVFSCYIIYWSIAMAKVSRCFNLAQIVRRNIFKTFVVFVIWF